MQKPERHIVRKTNLPWGGLFAVWIVLYAWDIQGLVLGGWNHDWFQVIFNITLLVLATYMLHYVGGQYAKSRR